MAEEEVRARLSVTGGDESAREIDKVTRGEKDLAAGTKEAGVQAERASEKTSGFGRTIGFLRGQLVGLVGMFTIGRGISAAFREWEASIQAVNERLEKNLQLTQQLADTALNLQFLGVGPEDRAQITEATAATGRDPNEGLRAFADIRSRRPNLDFNEQMAIFLEALETGQTTDAPLQSVTDALLTIQKFEADPQRAQNILRQSIIEAGVSDPAKLSPLFGKTLGILTGVGGLTTGEASGLTAAVTGLGLPPEVAATGLINIALGLQGKGTPEGNKIIERLGLDRTNLLTSLPGLIEAKQRGDVTDAELESIGGREGLPVLSTISDPARFAGALQSTRRVADAQKTDVDLTRESLVEEFGRDSVSELNQFIKQQRFGLQDEQSRDQRTLTIRAARAAIERELERLVAAGEISPRTAEFKLEIFDSSIARGLTINRATRRAEINRPIFSLSVPFSRVDLRTPLSEEFDEGIGLGLGPISLQDIPATSGGGTTVIDNSVHIQQLISNTPPPNESDSGRRDR